MKQKHNYFVLDKAAFSFRQTALTVIKLPYLLIKWLISFILARNIAHLALGPDEVKPQSTFNLARFIDDTEEASDAVVINLFPHEPNKTLQDYLLKFSGSWLPLPFITLSQKKQLFYKNTEDREYIDKIITELDSLVEGNSELEKFRDKKFSWDSIHFKGLSCLDEKMRAYFFEKLQRKYGAAAITNEKKQNLNFFALETSDYSVLDSVEVIAKGEENKPISERKFVIACLARTQNFMSWLKDYNYSAEKIGCTVVGFNYRGIDYSKGMVWTEQNMIDDALAQVERLLALGAKPENIGLEGMCIGGAVATIAAATLHDRGLKVKLYNERSFRSIPRFITGFVLPEAHASLWNPLNIIRYIVAGLMFIITYPFIMLVGWSMDAAQAWDRIPAEDKNYSVIRPQPGEANLEEAQLDGVVHDSWASIASLIDEKQDDIINKSTNGNTLTSEEEQLLLDPVIHHSFQVTPEVNFRTAHTVARRHLVHKDKDGQIQSFSMHHHMIDSFTRIFSNNPPLEQDEAHINNREYQENGSNQNTNNSQIRRPLAIAASGGAGHIVAIQGLIENMLENPNSRIEIPLHQAKLYSQQPGFLLNGFLRMGIYLSSVRGLGFLINKFARATGSFGFPNHELFWNEMERLEKKETDPASDPSQPTGRRRPYIDILLDVHPQGYLGTAMNNVLHRSGQHVDVRLLLEQKEISDELSYDIVYKYFLDLLIDSAKRGEPYTEIISTQPLFLPALCDAVIEYNTNFLKTNERQRNRLPLQPVAIHQYLTDLPSIGCDHYLRGLAQLTPIQKQQLHVYALNLRLPMLMSYFESGKDFLGIHNLSFKDNPMIRKGFKNPALAQYLSHEQELELTIKEYSPGPNSSWVPNPQPGKVIIPQQSKVASIMLSSLGSDSTIDYVRELLNNNYDQIFVFGGLGQYIYSGIEELLNEKAGNDPQRLMQLKERIILLGNQDDSEIAPIMTRSDCVIIRGGMSGMEQAALPQHKDKIVLFDQASAGVDYSELGPEINHEDGNAEELIAYFKTEGVYAKRASYQQFSQVLIDRELTQIAAPLRDDNLSENINNDIPPATIAEEQNELAPPCPPHLPSRIRRQDAFTRGTQQVDLFFKEQPRKDEIPMVLTQKRL